MTKGSLPPGYFDALYEDAPDPWGFAHSPYERAKYAATLTALPRSRYASALEVGCSIGVLTRDLAARCDALLAVDAAAAPLAAARARCAGLPGLIFDRAAVPGDWPEGRFDLILLSEVVYYLDLADVVRLAGRVGTALAPGGDVLLVHWTGPTDYPLSGDAAAEAFIAAAPFATVTRQVRAERYRLDLLRRRD
jgi:SAM-dependent methyltransferase